ncbi:MAG: delta-lactam-biosynthetic de-N-acetylase [Ruminococcaceae bacterium]|nr:delta-lactam-biosynthetic de-N-acetylase [Oscillospiraceae bacterium]
MKRVMTALFTCAAMLLLLGVNSYAYSRQSHGWYCMRAGGKAPEIEPQLAFIEKYNGYFLDRNAKEDDKVIYLTFDAGYENGNVERILDTLKKHKVKGAFFVLENLIKRNTELVCRMAKEGHLVCNHTASHKDMTKISDIDSFEAELGALEDVYEEYTGMKMAKFYRPPEGKVSEENMYFADKLGYATVFWSLAYADWDNNAQPSADQAFNKLISNTHNGMVLLLHPTSATNAEILGRLITEWKKQGYRFGDLNELCKK